MRRRTRLLVPIVVLVLAAAVAACSGDSDGADGTPGTSSAPGPTETPGTSDAPPSTTEPTESEPTESEGSGGTDSPAKRAKKAQIVAEDLPGLNDQWTWAKDSSAPGPGQDVPSVCQKASLTAIGAVTEYRTDFSSPLTDEAYAVQMTGVFPDEQTVATAESVLASWQKSCRTHATQDLHLKKVTVGDLQTVATDAGDGAQWLTTYGPAPSGSPDEGWFEAAGYVADGDTLTFLVMANVGQDYNYEQGQQPMDLAVQQAADQLIASR